MESLLVSTDRGLYCPAGDFSIDPWEPVERAVITHAHSDHLRPGSSSYLCAEPSLELLRLRLGDGASIQTAAYGESVAIGPVRVSLHPAGHILGSAQVRCDRAGEVWVVSGDYKTERDRTTAPFELLRCDTFITESTFGLPIYRWRPEREVIAEIDEWWGTNADAGETSIVYAYALGKAQRILAGIDAGIGPILAHGAVHRYLDAYRAAGVGLPAVGRVDVDTARAAAGRALVVAPPSAASPGWLRKFGEQRTAFASGWMQVRGARRRRAVDRGFVLSDHVDWPALLATIDATGAESVGVTHGYSTQVVQFLTERGRRAWTVPTRYEGEPDFEAQPPEMQDADSAVDGEPE